MRNVRSWYGLCLGLILTGVAQGSTPDAWRLLGVWSNCFDYVFTSVAISQRGRPILAFNEIGGRTYFVQEGDALGSYTVESFTPKTERVFNPNVQAYLSHNGGTVTLRRAGGERVVLEMGKPLPQPGLLARLGKWKTGETRYVRMGDTLWCSPLAAQVIAIAPSAVELLAEGKTWIVSPPSEAERAHLTSLHASARETGVRNPSRNEARRAEPPGFEAAPAIVAPRGAPLVHLTFDPFTVVREVPRSHPIDVSITTWQPGTSRGAVRVVKIPLPLPQFQTVMYRGSVVVQAE